MSWSKQIKQMLQCCYFTCPVYIYVVCQSNTNSPDVCGLASMFLIIVMDNVHKAPLQCWQQMFTLQKAIKNAYSAIYGAEISPLRKNGPHGTL